MAAIITRSKHSTPEKAKEFFENKIAFTTGPVEMKRMIDNDELEMTIIDVRAKEDFKKGHLPGAINLPKEKWDSLEGLAKDKLNVVYCYNAYCHLAATACVDFASKGYRVMELEGGFDIWKKQDMPVKK